MGFCAGRLMKNVGRGLTFIAGSIVGGLALAFVLIVLRPELIRPDGRLATGGAPTGGATAAGAPTAPGAPGAAAPNTAASRADIPAPARVTYSAAVDRAAPSVVNIYTARLVTERVAPSSLGELFGGFLPRYRQRVERSLGSGVIVDADGHIVTNHHVIAQADLIRVQLADGRIAEAHIVGRRGNSRYRVRSHRTPARSAAPGPPARSGRTPARCSPCHPARDA